MQDLDIFYKWLKENWTIAGGLIRKADAAKILRKTTARIEQMVKENKLQEYRFGKAVFLSYAQVMEIARKNSIENTKTV